MRTQCQCDTRSRRVYEVSRSHARDSALSIVRSFVGVCRLSPVACVIYLTLNGGLTFARRKIETPCYRGPFRDYLDERFIIAEANHIASSAIDTTALTVY